MKYFFILGRNPELSRAEIISYLGAEQAEFNEILFDKTYFIIETDAKINIQDLGGCLMLGKILFEGTESELADYLDENEVIPEDKFTYSVLGNADDEILINKFKFDRKKAIIRRGRRNINMQDGGFVSVPNAEFSIFMYKKDKIYFGVSEQDYSYTEIKERDMKKPVRRESLAISPRLAKILINLSQAKPRELLLDPFCGVGGILQEALVRQINVYGIDKDTKAIESARRNLKWLEQNFKINASYTLMNADSRHTPKIKFDAVATEPDLGEVLKHRPDKKKAKEIIAGFETLITQVLQRLQELRKFNAKIVFTSPNINNQGIDINKVLMKTRLNLSKIAGVKFPLREFREEQVVSRDIWILE